MSVSEHIPSPADAALPTAAEFLDEIRAQGGKVYRMREHHVFVITRNAQLAERLLKLRGLTYRPVGANPSWDFPLGAYRRSREGPPEWDIYIHAIPVSGDETIWQAAGKRSPTVEAVDFR